MPQMAPINWLTLLFYFIITFWLFNVTTYFLTFYYPLDKKKLTKNLTNHWKW